MYTRLFEHPVCKSQSMKRSKVQIFLAHTAWKSYAITENTEIESQCMQNILKFMACKYNASPHGGARRGVSHRTA